MIMTGERPSAPLGLRKKLQPPRVNADVQKGTAKKKTVAVTDENRGAINQMLTTYSAFKHAC
jgi:hypothetical protein